jgi:hypothetical protein
MNIYLQHPTHGTKVATMELEAVADELNGWVRYTHDAPVAPLESEAETVSNNLNIKQRPPRRSSTLNLTSEKV